MADNLDDGEFWLPSQFLTDDDILEDFKSEGFLSTETETSDDDDVILLGSCKKEKKSFPSTGSPQSTLYGWEYTTRQGSSHGSPSPQKETRAEAENEDNSTLNLLNKAAGEVAKMKKRSEKNSGTGFFDCSNSGKGLLCPPVKTQPLPIFQPPLYSYPHFRFPPHMMYGPVQLPPPQQPRQIQNRATKNTNTKINNVSNDRPLGLPPSAWPPLPGQAQPLTTQPQQQSKAQPQPEPQPLQPQAQPMMSMYAIPQGMSVGTGVFLPRVVPTTSDSKKKSDVNVMKTKNNKGSQRRNARLTKANDMEEIKLPSEWVY